jgi:hypothetical protein
VRGKNGVREIRGFLSNLAAAVHNARSSHRLAKQAAGALAAGDRRRDLDGGDAGDIERVSRLGADEGFDPGTTGLDHVPLDEGAGIEKAMRHLIGARG